MKDPISREVIKFSKLNGVVFLFSSSFLHFFSLLLFVFSFQFICRSFFFLFLSFLGSISVSSPFPFFPFLVNRFFDILFWFLFFTIFRRSFFFDILVSFSSASSFLSSCFLLCFSSQFKIISVQLTLNIYLKNLSMLLIHISWIWFCYLGLNLELWRTLSHGELVMMYEGKKNNTRRKEKRKWSVKYDFLPFSFRFLFFLDPFSLSSSFSFGFFRPFFLDLFLDLFPSFPPVFSFLILLVFVWFILSLSSWCSTSHRNKCNHCNFKCKNLFILQVWLFFFYLYFLFCFVVFSRI